MIYDGGERLDVALRYFKRELELEQTKALLDMFATTGGLDVVAAIPPSLLAPSAADV